MHVRCEFLGISRDIERDFYNGGDCILQIYYYMAKRNFDMLISIK